MITQSELKELVNYNPDTGIFTWVKNRGPRAKAGMVLGSKHKDGYLQMQIKEGRLLLHRAAWLYMYGRMPIECIDHINGDKTDNRLANIRECTKAQNNQNQKHPRVDNESGVMGVRYKGGKTPWQANISSNGKQMYIGSFTTAEAAHAAYVAKKREIHAFGVL